MKYYLTKYKPLHNVHRPLFIVIFLLIYTGLAQAQWIQTNGPFGGVVTCITPSNDGMMYAGLQGGGIYRSADNGDSWINVSQRLPGSYVPSMISDSSGTIFAVINGHGIYKSSDSGSNWIEMNNGITNFGITSIVMNSMGHLYAGAINSLDENAGVYQSIDQGESWTFLEINAQMWVDKLTLTVNSQDHLFVGTDGEMMKSTDYGMTWSSITIEGLYTYVLSFGINSNDDIFVGLNFGDGLYRSIDNGETWELKLEEDVYSIAIDESNNLFAGTYGNGIFHSSNNGETWETANNGLTSQNINSLCAQSPDYIYAGTYGVFRSADTGNNWEASYDGMLASKVISMDVNSANDIFAVSEGIYRSQDEGNNYENITSQITDATFHTVKVHTNGDIYATALYQNGGGLFRSRDNGNSWTELLNGTIWSIPKGVDINNDNEIFLITGGDGVFKSSDDGLTWQGMNTGLDCSELSSIAINDSGTIMVGSSCYYTGVYRSTDNGESWSPVNNGINSSGITTLTTNTQGHFFAGTNSNLIYRSTDNGDSWYDIGLDPSNFFIFSIVTDNNDRLYASCFNGVYQSTDNGDTWESISDGLSIIDIRSLAISNSGMLFSGTNGSSVWKRAVSVNTGFVKLNEGLMIYPNPANSEVTISYQSYNVSKGATINIYSIYGTLVQQFKLEGSTTKLNISGLTKGIYMINLNGDTIGKKLVKQ